MSRVKDRLSRITINNKTKTKTKTKINQTNNQ
jgi:hypothetical protein